MFNDGLLLSNTAVVDDFSLTVSVLTIKRANDSNSGAYTCIVNDPKIGVINRDTAYVDVTGEFLLYLLYIDIIICKLCVPASA